MSNLTKAQKQLIVDSAPENDRPFYAMLIKDCQTVDDIANKVAPGGIGRSQVVEHINNLLADNK